MARNTFVAAGVLAILWSNVSKADSWVPVYSADFSSDPGWVTNDPANLGWDSTTNTFHGWQANTNTSYSYMVLPSFDSSESFRLEWDLKVNYAMWSAGCSFGLWNSNLWLGQCVIGDFSNTDWGHGQGFYAPPLETSTNNPQWSTETWYSNTIEYNSDNGIAVLTTSNRDTGASVYHQTLTGLSLSSEYNRLGVSRLFMEGYTTNAVDYNLDNVTLSVPEPCSLVLFAGVLGLLSRRRRTA